MSTNEDARTPSQVLSVAGLRKVYGNTVAVDEISFEVRRNEIVGLLGPNGAGKTTTINMLLGVLEPDKGSILVEGIDLARHRSQVLGRTNFAAVYAPLPGNLTVWQNLRIFGLIYGVKALNERIAALLKQYDLEKLRDVKCGLLSSGEQTRVCLAKAMLNSPKLLLLDEATSALYSESEHLVQEAIERAMKDRTVCVIAHRLSTVKDADKVIVLDQGRF